MTLALEKVFSQPSWILRGKDVELAVRHDFIASGSL